jgi:MFS family permease
MRRQRSLLHLMAAMTLTAAATSSQVAWQVPFLMRVHALPLATAALVVGLAFGIANTCGQIGGGWLVNRLARNDAARVGLCTAGFALVSGLFMVFAAQVDSLWLAIPLLSLWALPAGGQYGPVLGTIQGLVMPRMRGIATSSQSLLIYLLGAGLGPLYTGMLSDRLASWAGSQSIRYALTIASLTQFWAALHFMLAARSLRADVERVNELSDATTGSATH